MDQKGYKYKYSKEELGKRLNENNNIEYFDGYCQYRQITVKYGIVTSWVMCLTLIGTEIAEAKQLIVHVGSCSFVRKLFTERFS